MTDYIELDPKDELQQLWATLSEATQKARRAGQYAQANEGLRQHLPGKSDAGLDAALRLWIADNLMMELRYQEAIEQYRELAGDHASLSFDGQPGGYGWAAYALERAAGCHERLGDLNAAIDTMSEAGKLAGNTGYGPHIHYRTAQLLEAARRDPEAIAAYQQAADGDPGDDGGAWPIGEFSRRQAASLAEPGHYFADPEALALTLVRALAAKDSAKLDALASPTHFCMGAVCSEAQFVDRKQALELITADLASSEPISGDVKALVGGGSKYLLRTNGWKGGLLQGDAHFLLVRLRAGWEWSGVALSAISPGFAKLVPAVEPLENQPLEIPIKAPWLSGDCWRAGGLFRFLDSLAPFYGFFRFLEDNFSCCGFGQNGYYFNYATHTGTHAFAIDFTRYVTGLPLMLDTHYKDVLSVQDGVVTAVSPTIVADHDHSGPGNIVRVETPGLRDLFAVLLRGQPLVPPFKFRSEYWHLAGGRTIPVSVGMFVRQGAVLGFCDNTGFSFYSHLHFVIQDRDMGFLSVRPNPMDGQRLHDGDDGRCVRSTNLRV